MTPISPALSNSPIRLCDKDVLDFLEETDRHVVVEVSTDWCIPCRLLRPIVDKLAAEFVGHLGVIVVDGDKSKRFNQTYDVHSFPQLLFFKDGLYVESRIGFSAPEEIRESVANFLRVPTDTEGAAAERSFREAYLHATARFTELTASGSYDLESSVKATAPAIEALAGKSHKYAAEDRARSECRAAKRRTPSLLWPVP
jgi:thioredoxin 1